MTAITFDVTLFRERFTEFEDPGIYTTAALTLSWDIAACYISVEDYGWLCGAPRGLAIQLMTAHIQKLQTIIASGQTAALLTAATVDKVSVSAMPPPVKTQLEWWLSLTPYGQQLWALLSIQSVGGLYIGGSPERAAFRGVGGVF